MRNPLAVSRHPLQKRYLAIVLTSILIPTLLLASCLYLLVFALLAEEMALPEGLYGVLIPVFGRINLILAIGLPVVVAGLMWWALRITHRIAGPIERIERELDGMIAKKRIERLQIRSQDDLKGVAERLNQLFEIQA